MSLATVLHGCALLWWYTLVVGVIVIVHEFGHYAVALLFRVRVQVFSFGFGPRLFGLRRGETDFRCSAIPLGGYVSMADGPAEDPHTLAAKPRWQRILIALAGPLINVMLSVCVVAGLFMVRFPAAGKLVDPLIGWVDPNGPASRAGIREGDRIVGIEDARHPSWEEVQMREIAGEGRATRVSVLREGEVLHVLLTPGFDAHQGGGYAGWGLGAEVRIADVTADMPAARAGLRTGDVLTSINGLRISSLQSVQRALEAPKGGVVELVYQRGGQERRTTVAPVRARGLAAVPSTWMIGVALEPSQGYAKLAMVPAIVESVRRNAQFANLILRFFVGIFERRMSPTTISGPFQIAMISEAAAHEGSTALLELIATISLNLAIINLLPLPILDGGVVLLLLIEVARGKDVDFAVRAAFVRAGAALLLALAAFVIYNDLSKLLPGG
jgi:regulator of sigma E protease